MPSTLTLPMNGKFSGMHSGDALVPSGADLKISGMIDGNVIVEHDAKVRISGMVSGEIVDLGGEIAISGMTG